MDVQSEIPPAPRTAAMALVLLVVTALGLAACEADKPPLPQVGAVLTETSVSGLSSGAYMAGQFEFAHSRIVVGAGIIAGGPYGCAENAYAHRLSGPGAAFFNLSQAINGCMLNAMEMWGIPNPKSLFEKARERARRNEIDPLDNIARHRVYLFSGTKDHTVATRIVAAAAEVYRLAGVGSDQISVKTDMPAGHAFVTSNAGRACGATRSPYIEDCDYDQAGALLSHIYGPLKPRTERPAGRLTLYDQREFDADLDDHGLAGAGFVYIPPACGPGAGCRVHIAFHGCNQNREKVGDTFAKTSGFLEWADTNGLIVLFPQVRITTLNPQGCWDWWGYSGRAYLTRRAPQIVAVTRMLERLAGEFHTM